MGREGQRGREGVDSPAFMRQTGAMGLDGKTSGRVWTAARSGSWLNSARVRAYLRLLALANVLSLGWLLLSSRAGLDPQGRLLGTDFVSFWAAGQVVQAGGNPYDLEIHRAAEALVWNDTTGYTAFFYPPLFLLWCWPLGLFGYFPALAGWLIATGGAWILALRHWAGRIDWIALIAFPPLLIAVTHGQTALLLAALLGGGFRAAAQGRTGLAGLLLGLAAFKPQFGVLVPLVLIFSRQWVVIGWATATVLASAALTTLAFGPEIWIAWAATLAPAQQAMAGGAIGFGKMQSVFAALRLLGAPADSAYLAQGALALGVATVLARLGWGYGLTPEVGATALAGALLATPFVLDYDFAVLAFPLILLARAEPRAWERTIAALAFAIPAFARPLGMFVGVPLAPLVVLALFVVLARRAAEPVRHAA